ncbi:glutaredoxin family protein [Halorussus halophilus]|uniref:glutaredoxin family protein n=1 Tax=Halorussus halophilus TaxID=2650975 RepID=UPI0013013CC3|nr:glutaredoxin domain-containing protein [Halorussus halophilus]
MTFQRESELTEEEAETKVESVLSENDVVLFMKGNELMPQCGYSQRALELVTKYRDDYETVDVLKALPEYRAALEAESGWETIPQTFVNGEFVGGSDVLNELDERGELEETLNA